MRLSDSHCTSAKGLTERCDADADKTLRCCCCTCSDFGVEDKLLGYAERAAASSLKGSIPGVWGKLQNLRFL
jgi:hypothetical protein